MSQDTEPAQYKDFVALNHSEVESLISLPVAKRRGPRGGVVAPFPIRLFNMLEAVESEGLHDVVSWQTHGRSFKVHSKHAFERGLLSR